MLSFLAIACCVAVGATVGTPASAHPPTKWQLEQQEKFKNSAPADEYFGHQKLSFLGMNNAFHDAAISAGDHTTDPHIVGTVAVAEDALDDWGRKYPRDPQLARTYFLAIRADRKIWLKPNQERAWNLMNLLVERFPQTYFGKLIRKEISIGFTEHYYGPPAACGAPAPIPSVFSLGRNHRISVEPAPCLALPPAAPTAPPLVVPAAPPLVVPASPAAGPSAAPQ